MLKQAASSVAAAQWARLGTASVLLVVLATARGGVSTAMALADKIIVVVIAPVIEIEMCIAWRGRSEVDFAIMSPSINPRETRRPPGDLRYYASQNRAGFLVWRRRITVNQDRKRD